MSTCMSTCMCFKHVYMYMHKHVFMCMHVLQTCLHVHACASNMSTCHACALNIHACASNMSTCTCIYMPLHVLTHTYVCTYLHVHAYALTCPMYMHVLPHVHMYMHVLSHVHACSLTCPMYMLCFLSTLQFVMLLYNVVSEKDLKLRQVKGLCVLSGVKGHVKLSALEIRC